MTVWNFLVEFRSRIGSFNIQEKGKPVQIGVLRQARNLHFYTSFFWQFLFLPAGNLTGKVQVT